MEETKVVVNILEKSEKPLKAGEIAQASGLDKKLVDKAIKILKKEEVIYSPKRCFYDVKK